MNSPFRHVPVALVCVLLCMAPASQDAGNQDPQQEMLRLFQRIERDLKQIDALLSEAASGSSENAPERSDAAGLGRFLRESQDRGEQVVQGIDRLLTLAAQQQQQQQQQQGQGSGQGQNQDGPQPGSGQQPKQGGQSSRENTPQAPGDQPQGEQPKGAQEDQKQGGQTPQDTQATNPLDGSNRQGAPRPARALGDPSSLADPTERWGELPERARALFTAEGGGDLPVEYRDWIDTYYQRLNRSR